MSQGVGYTKEDLESLRAGFEAIDTSGDGLVTPDEFEVFAKQADIQPIFQDVIYFYFNYPEKGISFDQFVNFFIEFNDIDTNPTKFAKIIFDRLDADASGSIDKSEFKEFAKIFHLTPAQAQNVMSMMDDDNNGSISFEELVKAFSE